MADPVTTEERPQAAAPAAAPPEPTPADSLRAEFDQFKKEFHTAKSDWGRERAKLVRERDSFQAVKDLPEDARERLADLAESREELAEKAGVDPDLIPLADYKTMRASAAKLTEAISARTSALDAKLKVFEAKITTPPETEREPMPSGGTAVRETQITKDNADQLWLAGKITDERYRSFMPR